MLKLSVYFSVVSLLATLCTAAGSEKVGLKVRDEDAAAVMNRVAAKMKTHSSVKGTLRLDGGAQHMTVKFAFKKPNLISYVEPDNEMHCSGKETRTYSPRNKSVMTIPAAELKAYGGATTTLIGLTGILADDVPDRAFYLPKGKAKRSSFRGQKAIVIPLEGHGYPMLLYVNEKTLDPIAFTSPDGTRVGIYKGLAFDKPLKASDFAWSPPPGTKKKPFEGF